MEQISLASTKPALSTEQAHVFFINYEDFNQESFSSLLSADEQLRAEKLKVELKKQQFVITRGILRLLLASCINNKADAIVFNYAEHCKPKIDEAIRTLPIEFNVSHSGQYGVIALTLGNKIGIDIEQIDPKVEHESLVKRFCSEQEKHDIEKLVSNDRLQTFYEVWVRKESFIKATGKGVAYGLDKFTVPVLEKDKFGIKVKLSDSTDEQWFCYDLPNIDDYKMALTTNKPKIEILISELV